MISDITCIYIISIVPSRNFSSTLDFPQFTCHSSWVLTDIIFIMRNSVGSYTRISYTTPRDLSAACADLASQSVGAPRRR